jgi:predicted 3-demethylubiquinone-9 3-methyltransferase (glyoxalase superfamily)
MRRNRNSEEGMAASQKITPCLWFDSEAEEAARFYVSVFKDARIGRITITVRKVSKSITVPKVR